MENKYITTLKGMKLICQNIFLNEDAFLVRYESFDSKKQKLLDDENYEEVIKLTKLKYFDLEKAQNFWDSFDIKLYLKILKEKSYELQQENKTVKP